MARIQWPGAQVTCKLVAEDTVQMRALHPEFAFWKVLRFQLCQSSGQTLRFPVEKQQLRILNETHALRESPISRMCIHFNNNGNAYVRPVNHYPLDH